MKRAMKGFAALLVTLALCVSVSVGAFALEEEDAIFLRSDGQPGGAAMSPEIINFKAMLYELGFYSAGVDSTTLQTLLLDDLTMAAVRQVCNYNPELNYYDEGVSYELYWRVKGEGEPLKTPLDEAYQPLTQGSEGDAVKRIQNRLNLLGYDAVGVIFEPGQYDDALQKAIDAFVRCNKLVYEEGISVAMQERLFSDEAIPYSAEEANTSLSDRLLGYLTAKSSVMGVRMPNAAIWGIGFVLLCVIVILMLTLFTSGEEKSAQGRGNKATKAKKGEVRFEIEYDNKKRTYSADKGKYVRIGRATGDFPLNLSDESISRKHCEIYFENGVMMLRDFSSYGTRINGEMCHHSQHMVRSGDVIEVGQHKITIEF